MPAATFFETAVKIIKVLIADDQAPLRTAVREHLEAASGIQVVGEARDGHEAVALARSLAPHVALIDVQMPGMGGIAATREIVASLPQVRVIGLSQHADRAIATAMREAGADDYVLKDELYERLIPAIRAAAAA